MTFSIAQKLLTAFVGLTLLVLIATLGLARWSFQQGFLDYVNALEQTRLEHVQADLAAEYLAAGGNWNTFSQQRFAALVRRSAPRGRPAGPPPENMPPPTALYDIHNNLIAGASLTLHDSHAIRVPVMVDGSIVGELRSEPRRHFNSPQETEFSRQQLKTSWFIGISSLILAFGVSLFLARGLLAPIRRMLSSVARLSGGDYSHRMNETRRDELGQLTKDLDRLGSTLEANQSSRKRLLADVSHELRTPLTVLSGEIEALKDGLREFDLKQLNSLDQEVQRLRYLVDDLYELSISDVGGLRYQFANIDLKNFLQHSLDGMRSRAEALNIQLNQVFPDHHSESICSTTISADVQRLDQLMKNVMENSLAYTDAPGEIVVTLSYAECTATITIEDTPPGVDESDCKKLFDPLFRQEVSRSRRTGGAGLGLAICSNIVTAHGGSISASPSVLGGLCICIELPISIESDT